MSNKKEVVNVDGLHLWTVRFKDEIGDTDLLVTTNKRDPSAAIRKANAVAKARGLKCPSQKIEWEGTLDA